MLETVLIILFTLFFIWVAWWKLDWAITLAILFLPAYLLRFQTWFVPMTILEVMVLVVVVIWLVKLIQNAKSKIQNVGFWWPWKWLTILWVLTGVVAVLISPDIRQALGLWKAYILEPVLFFIVFVNVIKTEKQVRSILWALGSLIVVVGFVTILQYLNIFDIPGDYGLEIPRRATSFFPFPTAVGKLVGPLLALFLGLWLARKEQRQEELQKKQLRRLFIYGVVTFGFIGLILSVSRGALIGVFASLIFISFFSRYKKWLWLGLVLVVLAAMLIAPIRNNVVDVFQATDVSTDVRLVMWKGAVRIIKDNPITGTGLASFPVVYEEYKEASHTEFFPNPDHLILTLWIEMGLAGLIIFGWLIVRYCKAGIGLLKEHKDYSVGLLAAMIALLVYGFLDTPYFKNDLAIAFWVLAALVIIMERIDKTPKTPYN